MDRLVLGSFSILVLAILILVGGIIGFKKAKSRASLISGIISALLLAFCYWLSLKSAGTGFKLACLVAAALEGIFIVRLIKTKKFMPSGLMLVFCLTEQTILLLTMPKG